jgi:energy-converting hydrogenase Eha subunit C
MLPWIHSIRRVHHRSSHEYLRVVAVREQGKGETVVTTPIDQIGLMSLIDCMIVDPWASVFYLDILIVLSSVV